MTSTPAATAARPTPAVLPAVQPYALVIGTDTPEPAQTFFTWLERYDRDLAAVSLASAGNVSFLRIASRLESGRAFVHSWRTADGPDALDLILKAHQDET